MKRNNGSILSFNNLGIGFESGKFRRLLLPPLTGSADNGELIAVIGKNGIGKSTLLRTFAGLQTPLAGELTIDDKSIAEFSRMELSARIGYISTEIIRVSNMKVYDLVSLGRFPHTNWLGRIDRSDHEVIIDSIAKTGMTDFRERPVTELSDGERQRAMIAMVLAQDAGIMLMDEPTAFLDLSSKFEIIHLLHELTRSRDKTIIFSTHDLGTAVSQADKIWLLKEDGLAEGAPEDLMLDGSFKTLFDETKVKFDSRDGSFSFRNVEKGRICVRGEGEVKQWTEKALSRVGYAVVEEDSAAEVEVPSQLNSRWKCKLPGYSIEFESIYDLISWIRRNDSIS